MPCKLPKIILNQPGNFRLLQMAFASSLVEIGFEFFPSLAVVFNLGKMLPLRTERFGKAAGEMERDELRQARLVAMREIPPLMPAAKTALRPPFSGARTNDAFPLPNRARRDCAADRDGAARVVGSPYGY